jgi:phosphoglycolate phosphatase
VASGLRAVLWDLDGTLLDSNQSIRATMNAVLKERGHAMFTKAELDTLIGYPLRDILAKKVPSAPKGDVETMALRYRELYSESGWFTVGLHAGVDAYVQDLRRQGFATGIVTSKGQHETEILLADLGVLSLFDIVIGDDDVRPLKPDPAPFRAACEGLGCAADSAVLIGDTRFDMLSAKSAGGYGVGVLWGNGSAQSLREAGADAIVADVAQLRTAVRRLAGRLS